MINPQHIVTFVQAALAQRVPLHRWTEAWQNAQASHMAQIRRDIWEAKQQGLIVERDGRLYTPENDPLRGEN